MISSASRKVTGDCPLALKDENNDTKQSEMQITKQLIVMELLFFFSSILMVVIGFIAYSKTEFNQALYQDKDRISGLNFYYKSISPITKKLSGTPDRF